MKKFVNFKLVRLNLPGLETVEGNQSSIQDHLNQVDTKPVKVLHHLFIRPHESRSEEFPKEKTLFIANIPADLTEEHLKNLFYDKGTIEQVKWSSKRTTGSSCHVIFEDKESIEMIMEMDEKIDCRKDWPTQNCLESN